MFMAPETQPPVHRRSQERNATRPVLIKIPPAPANGAGPRWASRCYKHLTPNGVKARALFQ